MQHRNLSEKNVAPYSVDTNCTKVSPSYIHRSRKALNKPLCREKAKSEIQLSNNSAIFSD
jgi:hypothetical protein